MTVTERSADPPAPVHDSVNVLVAVSVGVSSLPALALFPAHAPDAVHPVAFVLLQVSVERAPAVTVVGLAVRSTVGTGTGAALTVTVTDWLLVPAALSHESVNRVDSLSPAIVAWPLVARLPLQSLRAGLAEAVQAVAPAAFHASCVVPPAVTESGLPEKVTVGGTGWDAAPLKLGPTAQPGFCDVE